MASQIQGFEYDIFISYRQKDNKGDRWVSKFVDALKTELESTFKDDVSVYFDINPHNGLLETHDVDASLKEKLKCLIFIPILSRTYCDPRSFAWEHEFKAFVDQASNDRFGLRVKLVGGNVANRVLPVRIHDLNVSDVELFESTIGGVLRGVDFIYKSPGVNRPLRANEDHPQDNLNNTYYRDQINKVANAIQEIISSLSADQSATGKEKVKQWEPEKEIKKGDKKKGQPRKILIGQRSKKWLITLLSLVFFFAGVFAVFKLIKGSQKVFDIAKLEKSIAVLPFVNDSPDQENAYFINGLMGEVLNNLSKIKEFRVFSRTSTEQYRSTSKPTISEIGKKLDVNYIVEGSGQKFGNKYVLRVQLIAAHNERHLWGESYTREIRETSDIIGIQSQVAQEIAAELRATITPEEKQMIDKTYTMNLTALDFYQRGDDDLNKYYSDNANIQALNKAEEMYYKALDYDSTFARAYCGLAEIIFKRHLFDESYFSESYLDSALLQANRALSFDNHLASAYYYRANYYLANGNNEQAIKEFEKTIKYDPNFADAYNKLGYYIYIEDYIYADYVKGLQYVHKAVSMEHGKERAMYLRNYLGDAYGIYAGFPEKKKYYYNEAFKLDNDSGYLKSHKTDKEALESLKKSYEADSNNIWIISGLAGRYSNLGQYKDALKFVKKIEKSSEGQIMHLRNFNGIISIYLQNGYKEEAYKWFNRQVKMSEESLKLGRHLGIGANLDLAAAYALMGDKAKAYENLKIVAKPRVCGYWLLSVLKDPCFNSIKNEPEFQKIVSELESKYQAEHERVRRWLEEQGML